MEEMEEILQEENPSLDHESTTSLQNVISTSIVSSVSDEEILQEENPSLDHESTTSLQNVNSTSIVSSVSDEEILQEENPSLDHESTTSLQNVISTSIVSSVSDEEILQEENPSLDHESTTSLQNVNSSSIVSSVSDEGSSQKLQVPREYRKSAKWLLKMGATTKDKVNFIEESQSTSTRVTKPWRDKDCFSDGEDEEGETEEKVLFDDASSLNLRNYQMELAKHALEGHNTIIYARTGSGKTRVAADIIIKHLNLNRDDKHKPKKVCFLTKTVPLAVQQYNTIKKKLPKKYEIGLFTGDVEGRKSMSLLLDQDVVVLTPLILQNHITRGNLKGKGLSVFSLLIFDECHHTRKQEPYNIIMASYVDKKLKTANNLPQVIGLTASILMGKADDKEAKKKVLQLCANLDARFISVVVRNEDELNDLVPVPTETMEYLENRECDKSYRKIIWAMEKLEKQASEYAKDINNQKINEILEKIPSKRKCNCHIATLLKITEEHPCSSEEINLKVRLLMIIAQYLLKYDLALEMNDLIHVKDVIHYLDVCFTKCEFDKLEAKEETKLYDVFKDLKNSMVDLYQELNPNLRHLVDVIKDKMLKAGSLSRGIIFVRTRAIAEALASWLNRCENEEIRNLKANIFTGTNAKESQGGMTQSLQNALVDKFMKGDVRLLVATSVAEEGLDVPECNLVIRYNYVGNEITTIHTRGRSRKPGSHSVLLAMKNLCDKEEENKKLIILMNEAINLAREMPEENFLQAVKEIQEKDTQKRDIEEKASERYRMENKDIKFKMVCKGCKSFEIGSNQLRSLFGKHRLVVDRNIWKHLKIGEIDRKYIDEIGIDGVIKCRKDKWQSEGAKCKWRLGRLVSYYKCYFLAVGIKHFSIVECEEGGKNKTSSYQNWKDMPYCIEKLTDKDIEYYISSSGIQETEPASAVIGAAQMNTCPEESSELNQSNNGLEKTGVQETEPPSHSDIDQESDSSLSTYSSSRSHHETNVKELS